MHATANKRQKQPNSRDIYQIRHHTYPSINARHKAQPTWTCATNKRTHRTGIRTPSCKPRQITPQTQSKTRNPDKLTQLWNAIHSFRPYGRTIQLITTPIRTPPLQLPICISIRLSHRRLRPSVISPFTTFISPIFSPPINTAILAFPAKNPKPPHPRPRPFIQPRRSRPLHSSSSAADNGELVQRHATDVEDDVEDEKRGPGDDR